MRPLREKHGEKEGVLAAERLAEGAAADESLGRGDGLNAREGGAAEEGRGEPLEDCKPLLLAAPRTDAPPLREAAGL